jgi:glucan phosphoethanolaminetransferase (alkaline phosphatase superfamily)
VQIILQKFSEYKKDAALAMKHMWFVVALFGLVQVIVSIAVAAKNSTAGGGYKSLSFAAIWSMFLVIIFVGLGAQIVFRGQATALQVGFLIGVSAMLCQLFFVLMVIFFIVSTEATTSNYSKSIA